jgi:hypothetical protein
MMRDSRGRFKKKREEKEEDTEAPRPRNEITIYIPFLEYIPFFIILACLFVIAFPWLIIIKPITKKLMMFMGRAMIVMSRTNTTSVTATADPFWS